MTIKVLIVDDSAFMRVFLGKWIADDPSFEVVGTARNGLDAVARVKKWKPDVVTMDVEMPVMNGIEAVRTIMQEAPTPIIMLSSLTTQGADATMEALRYGAVDFLAKPDEQTSDHLTDIGRELSNKIRAAAGARLRAVNNTDPSKPSARPATVFLPFAKQTEVTQMVAIGTSTGGPRALDTLLTQLPADLPCPVTIVQHMPAKFTRSLADRLNEHCAVRVVEAQDGEPLVNGTVYIAPGGLHMEVKYRQGNFQIVLNHSDKRNVHRPSVDVLFESVTELPRLKKHYVLLTGMGSDGAQAMSAAKAAGSTTTIAESSNTCVVYGMPRAAIELNCVDHVLDLPDIAARIVDSVRTSAAGGAPVN